MAKKWSSLVADMPEVRRAVRDGADRVCSKAKALGRSHGSISDNIFVTPGEYPDWLIVLEAYDDEGRGFASSVEMGHINVPWGRKWTNGIHVLRDATRAVAN